MSARPRFRWAATLALGLGMTLSACDTTSPTAPPTAGPSASPRPAAEVYAEIRAAVETIRGLDPTDAVDPVTIDAAQLRVNFEAEFDAAYTPEQLKDTEDLLITLGLLPAGSSIRALTLDFQAGQVAGYYSTDKDELVVVSRTGGLGPADEVTYAHEFTHQLQDQNLDLDSLGLDAFDQSDQALARLALVEGDATSVQTTWMTETLTPRELGEVLAAGLDPAAIEALRRAPRYLRETATFPYEDGFAFVNRILATGGYDAVDAAFADPPDSTEQVLHPDRYLDREAPTKVTLPADFASGIAGPGAGWTVAAEDTLGELILRIWLREGGVTLAEARTATAGWGGDRLALLRGPPGGQVAVALITEWDSIADAEEFVAAARKVFTDGAPQGSVHRDSQQPTRVTLGFGPFAESIVDALTQ